MRYLGGKSRTAKAIVAAIAGHASWYGDAARWVEPFMGGGSVTVAVSRLGAFTTVCASDIDPLVVAYWTAIRDGWVPPKSVTFEEWSAVRGNPDDYPAEYVAHVAYNCSFGGRRWEGYARPDNRCTPPLHAAETTSRKDTAARRWIENINITCRNYTDALPGVGLGDVVYCDPPYAGTKGYRTGVFDHAAFWRHVQEASDRGALVYVSEYACPDHIDSEVIWSNVQPKSVAGGASPRPLATDDMFFIRPTA